MVEHAMISADLASHPSHTCPAPLPCAQQLLLQVQSLSKVPPVQQYKGLFDALRRIPEQEGGWLVGVGGMGRGKWVEEQRQGRGGKERGGKGKG